MKKKILILIAFILALPTLVFADAGYPSRKELDAKVTNPNGAVAYEYDYNNGNEYYYATEVIIPYDTIITITDEFSNYGYINYNDNGYYILLSDIEYIFNITVDQLEDSGKVFTVDVTDVYDLPSKGANKVGTIKAGVELQTKNLQIDVTIRDTVRSYSAFAYWDYVEYNDVKGWVYTSNYVTDEFNCTVANESYSTKLLVISDKDVYDYPSTLVKVDTVKALEEYTPNYTYFDQNTKMTYYNIGTGWISDDYLGITYNNNYKLFAYRSPVLVYDVFNSTKDEEVSHLFEIETEKTYDVLYSYNGYYLISINGNKYWVTTNDNSGFKGFNSYYEYEFTEEIRYYSSYDFTEDSYLGVLDPGTYNAFFMAYNSTTGTSTYYLEGFGYVITGGVYDPTLYYEYFDITAKFLTTIDLYSDEDLTTLNSSTLNDTDKYNLEVALVKYLDNGDRLYFAKEYGYFTLAFDIEDLEYVDTKKVVEEEKEESKLSALYIIGGAVVLAGAAAVTIILIVKKKKNKKVNVELTEEKKNEIQETVTETIASEVKETDEMVNDNEKKEE